MKAVAFKLPDGCRTVGVLLSGHVLGQRGGDDNDVIRDGRETWKTSGIKL